MSDLYRKRKPHEKKETSVHVRNISHGLKDHFKALCAKHGVSMTKAIEDFMGRAVEKGRLV